MAPVLLALLLSTTTTTPTTTTSATPQRHIMRLAVSDFEVSGVEPRVARIVAESLVFEVRKLERMSVISFGEVRQMMNLESEKQVMGCSSEESCLSQIADALGVDYLVVGTLTKVGDTHVFGLRMLNQTSATAATSVNKVVPAGSSIEFLGEIGPAVKTLFPDVPLRVGETRGISPELAKRLTPPPLPPALFWSTAATGGALVVGSGVAGLLQTVFQRDYKSTATRAETTVIVTSAAAVTSGLLGSARVAGDGSFTATLQVIDVPRVFVRVVDRAGNVGDAVRVQDIEWTASLGGRLRADDFSNPHALFTATDFDDRPRQQSAARTAASGRSRRWRRRRRRSPRFARRGAHHRKRSAGANGGHPRLPAVAQGGGVVWRCCPSKRWPTHRHLRAAQ